MIQKAAEEGLKKVADAVKGIAASEKKLFADAEDKIGDVGSAANKGAGGDQNSVNGIANGMKAIVDAAGGVEKVLKGVGEAGGGDNNDAGKLFAGSGAGAGGAGVNDVGKAVAAVNAVSGEQILKAIVDAAGGADKGGAAAGAAKNPIAAAIGTNGNGAAFGDGMQNKNDKIAAAIVLRGMAKGGKFSLANKDSDAHKAGVKSAAQSGTAKTVNALTSIIQKAAEEGLKKVADAEGKIGDVGSANNKGAEGDQNSVNGIANGMKAIVDAAGGVEKVLKGVGEAGGGDNNDAGKLFAGSGAGANNGAGVNDVGKAVAAVNAVSGEQILKAIVDAAGGADKVGAAAGAAKNPIAAAIGTDGNGAAFGDGMQNKNDKIAAAIVLRGMAKGGKFSLANKDSDAHKAGVKSAAQSGTAKTVNALTSIIQKAAEEGLKKVADAVKGIAALEKKLFADAEGIRLGMLEVRTIKVLRVIRAVLMGLLMG
nr:variable large family protein [Borreliella garinii]WNZ74074.1 variable large family protein [Borreliella garinii]